MLEMPVFIGSETALQGVPEWRISVTGEFLPIRGAHSATNRCRLAAILWSLLCAMRDGGGVEPTKNCREKLQAKRRRALRFFALRLSSENCHDCTLVLLIHVLPSRCWPGSRRGRWVKGRWWWGPWVG